MKIKDVKILINSFICFLVGLEIGLLIGGELSMPIALLILSFIGIATIIQFSLKVSDV